MNHSYYNNCNNYHNYYYYFHFSKLAQNTVKIKYHKQIITSLTRTTLKLILIKKYKYLNTLKLFINIT